MNEPPVILTPEENVVELTLTRERNTLQVVARDPEGEPVLFVWPVLDGLEAPITFAQPGAENLPIYFSSLSVPRDARYDNERIEVLITDGELQNGQYRTWFLELPE